MFGRNNQQVALRNDLRDMGQPTLDTLFAEASVYGCVHFWEHDNRGKFFCKIEFTTIANVSLEAKSGFQPSLVAAFQEAIANAKAIHKQFK